MNPLFKKRGHRRKTAAVSVSRHSLRTSSGEPSQAPQEKPDTTMTPKELREKRAKLVSRMQELRDKQESWTEAERTNWTEINAEYNRLTEQIEVVERMDAVNAEQRAAAGDPAVGRNQPAGSPAGQGPGTPRNEYLRDGPAGVGAGGNSNYGPVTQQHRDAAAACGIDLASNVGPGDPPGTASAAGCWAASRPTARPWAAMGVSVDTAGGYTAPEGFVANLETAP